MGSILSQLAKEVKQHIRFDQLFREFYPGNYAEQGNSRCPFHEDEQASFQVSKDHGFCHAGCVPPGNGAKSFDVISLVRAHKSLGFNSAVQTLAARCGLATKAQNKSRGRIIETYPYRDEKTEPCYLNHVGSIPKEISP